MKQIFSIFDLVGKSYGPLVLGRNEEDVKRDLAQSLADNPKSTLARHPHDFNLCAIGSFDDITGDIKSGCFIVCSLSDLVKQPFKPDNN